MRREEVRLIEAYFGAVGLTCGLVLASCLGGLPGANCAAMAKAYRIAIGDFGFTALLCFLGVLTFGISHVYPSHPPQFKKMKQVIGGAVIAGIGIAFFLSAYGASKNLTTATNYCLVGPSNEIPARQNRDINLAGPISQW